MAVKPADMTWTGPKSDVLGLWVRDRTLLGWLAVGIGDTDSALLMEADDNDNYTGRVAGVEIIGILTFDEWNQLPDLDILWQVSDWEPLPLIELLKREQAALRQQVEEGAA